MILWSRGKKNKYFDVKEGREIDAKMPATKEVHTRTVKLCIGARKEW